MFNNFSCYILNYKVHNFFYSSLYSELKTFSSFEKVKPLLLYRSPLNLITEHNSKYTHKIKASYCEGSCSLQYFYLFCFFGYFFLFLKSKCWGISIPVCFYSLFVYSKKCLALFVRNILLKYFIVTFQGQWGSRKALNLYTASEMGMELQGRNHRHVFAAKLKVKKKLFSR